MDVLNMYIKGAATSLKCLGKSIMNKTPLRSELYGHYHVYETGYLMFHKQDRKLIQKHLQILIEKNSEFIDSYHLDKEHVALNRIFEKVKTINQHTSKHPIMLYPMLTQDNRLIIRYSVKGKMGGCRIADMIANDVLTGNVMQYSLGSRKSQYRDGHYLPLYSMVPSTHPHAPSDSNEMIVPGTLLREVIFTKKEVEGLKERFGDVKLGMAAVLTRYLGGMIHYRRHMTVNLVRSAPGKRSLANLTYHQEFQIKNPEKMHQVFETFKEAYSEKKRLENILQKRRYRKKTISPNLIINFFMNEHYLHVPIKCGHVIVGGKARYVEAYLFNTPDGSVELLSNIRIKGWRAFKYNMMKEK